MYVIAYMRGSPAEGLGHISRCAAVCHALSARGVNIAVILDGGAFATRHLAARGLQPVTLSEAMAQAAPMPGCWMHWRCQQTLLSLCAERAG